MKIIVGLGNPGRVYQKTRHNIGFWVIDKIIQKFNKDVTRVKTRKYIAEIFELRFDGEKIVLVKPLTFMNLSGQAVKPIVDWYKIDIKNLIVIYDDMDLPLGTVRFREKGSSGGHKGMRSIIQHLGTEEFKRIRLGIDHPSDNDVIDYVLTGFTSKENQIIQDNLNIVSDAIEDWVKGTDYKKIMSTYQVKR